MLKRTLFFLLLLPFLVNAQVLTPVKWSTETKDLGNNEYEISLHAKIESGWHMYSQQHPTDGTGIPATITFEKNSNYELIGKTTESGKLLDKYSELFEQQEKYYESKVTFKQKVKLKSEKPVEIKFSAETQVCDAEKCLPPDWLDYSVKIIPKTKEENSDESTNKEDVTSVDSTEISTQDSTEVIAANIMESQDSTKTTTVSSNIQSDSEEEGGLWGIFLKGIIGGFLALLMPCIFPMIPLTVSLFTKQSGNRSQGIFKALIYGLSIVVIFVGFASLITLIFGGSALNEFATNPWLNIMLFAIFILFAISFFGAFEITLPSSWANFTDKQADKGGYVGIFFMAFTLVLISFSCTVPIIGGLAAQAKDSDSYLALIIGSLGFSIALALPFVLFAIFPSWLNSLPRSGGWMNVVKVCIGFIELAFAFKFLSNADLVWQAHILEREAFLAIWIAIGSLLVIYLIGGFRMKMDSPQDRIGVPRLFFATLFASIVIYMIPGMWGAPVKLLSGLTPPIQYSESPNGVGFSGGTISSSSSTSTGLIQGQKYGPHQIPAFLDMADAIEHSKKINKPIMIDFTGHACANCRKVEERVWSDQKIKQLLLDEVVLVSLYVDERTELPKDQQIFSKALGRNLKTVGNKWTAFEIEQYNNNAQPYYIIVDENLNEYNKPLGAIYDVEEYYKWMKQGIDGYNANKK
ncbi:protein-disulfide reductase DsbD family protein [Moheibacter sediminis]|uniref:Thiol:disulfide interchange protein DsbD n=1 Tax=Moheibacter sediminis TaxID=1434700 RepID=A0A1W1ZAS0_9FLAO|nr:cytochrome c biogenesis protein CcdA [Moheibacter sediminis]SMC45406.1 thiol:disulfide interchange protein DsbD [Moheibacter sediminis]